MQPTDKSNQAALILSAKDFVETMGWSEDKEKHHPHPGNENCFDLSEEEEKVVGLLKSRPDGLQINTLVVDTNIPVNRMSALLFELEMKGVLRVLAGGIYRLL